MYVNKVKPHVLTGTFGEALAVLKDGGRVARKGWNEKGMWLGLVYQEPGTGVNVPSGDERLLEAVKGVTLGSWIGIKTSGNKLVPWTASQEDVLADDWVEV